MSETKTLQELTDISIALQRKLAESYGEITPEIEALLEINEKEFPQKLRGYAELLDRMDTEAEHWKKKALVFDLLSKGCSKLKERLRANILLTLDRLGQNEIRGDGVKFSRQLSSGSLHLEEAKLPREYTVETVSYPPDKEKIKAALKSGVEVPGAQLIQSYSLRKYNVKD